MEIVSYVLDGTLAHEDSMGNGSTLRYGDVQRMSAGTGVRHSEFNHSADQPVHFLQIWIEPKFKGIRPSYEEKHFDAASKKGQLRLIVSPDGRDGSVAINQDASMYATILDGTDSVHHTLKPGRRAYVHIVRGRATVNGVQLKTGDALKLVSEESVSIGMRRLRKSSCSICQLEMSPLIAALHRLAVLAYCLRGPPLGRRVGWSHPLP